MPIQVLMPQLGESVVEGTITKWLVREGDRVTREQPIVEVATDKADSEVPAPSSGRVARIVVAEGETVRVGQPLCEIDPVEEATAPTGASPAPTGASPAPMNVSSARVNASTSNANTSSTSRGPDLSAKPSEELPGSITVVSASAQPVGTESDRRETGRHLASPLVRKLALEQGIDVRALEGSGARGRVTRDDVARAAEPKAIGGGAAPELAELLNSGALLPIPNVGFGSYRVPTYKPREGDQVIPFNRRRRLVAHHMTYSKLTAPHVVTVAEVDMDRTAKLREAHKDAYRKDGVPLTMLSFVAHAAVRALRESPTMNARVLEDAYVVLREINLGIAIDTPDGLIVPNIKHADELSLRGIAKAIDDLAQRARAGKITADDLASSSFSVSNPGLRGNLFGGAILAQPNVGILRMGEIKKRVVVIEADGQDVLAIHPVMYLALSYDHRIVDGVLGNSFLHRVSEILEKAEFDA